MSLNLDLGNPFGYVPIGSLYPYTDVTGRIEVSPTLNPSEKTFIGLITGQSLASSHIGHVYTVLNPTKVHSIDWANTRKVYQHKEPCFGGTYYEAGSIPSHNWNLPYISLWGKVGDLMIEADMCDRVIWVNVSAGGQLVESFTPGGNLYQRIPNVFNVLNNLGYHGSDVTAIISMIGESDGALNTPAETYKTYCRDANRVARSRGFTGPWFIPVETLSNSGTDAVVQQAQLDLSSEEGFTPGPNFDTLGAEYRDSGHVHQNALGHDTMAEMWVDVIKARLPR